MKKQVHYLLMIIFSSLLLSGCGGGGSSTTTPTSNTAQETAIEHIYQFAQNNSSAPTVQDYLDAGITGVTQENIDEVNAVVSGLTKEEVDTKEEIQAIVTSLQINIRPTVNAGNNKNIEVNMPVTITGSASDTDGHIVSYTWKEGGTILASTASFTYTPTTVGTHTLTLTVMDDDGATASDTMTVTVTAPAATNQAPTANAGSDRTVETDQSITISGSGSDSDGTIASYQWKEGTTILASTASFTFTAPSTAGTHTLTLIVTDDDGATASDTMTVTVTAPANEAPTADAGSDRSVQVNQTITITGSGSDADGTITAYEWKEGATILANSATFDYTPDTTGDHSLTFTVTDDDGATGSDTIIITVTEDSAIHITEDYQVEKLGTDTSINTTISIDTGAPKDLYLVLTNYDASNTASVSISHSSSKVVINKNTKQTFSVLENNNNKPEILPAPSHIQDFNNHVIVPEIALSSKESKVILVKSNSVEGDGQTFYLDASSSGDTTQATLRKSVTNISTAFGNKTLNIWVSDDCFDDTEGGQDDGPTCTKDECVTQDMVDALANTFLISNSDNDIYDWVTNIFGEEWGSDAKTTYSNLIDETDEINILLTDIDNDNSTNGGVVGYFYSKDNYESSSVSGSNEKIMFYADAVLFAKEDGTTWEIDDFWPKEMISTLAHEFQHMIHFYQKTILRAGEGTDTWLNEMLSETVEEVISTKINHDGPRGVDYTDGSAGDPNNPHGRYPDFNENNTLSLTEWSGSLADYSKVNAFGAYLTRNYGVEVLHDILQSAYIHEDAVENAVQNTPNGANKTFDDLLREWGVAVMLSDHENLQDTPLYNTGDFILDTYGNSTYQLGSINFFNYDPQPTIHTSNGTVEPQGNYYYKIGEGLSGTVDINITLNGTTEATLIAK